MDSDYLSAVECGDMETAQRMVDEAAVDFSPSRASVARVQISPANEKSTAIAVLFVAINE